MSDDGRNYSAQHLKERLGEEFDPAVYEAYVKVFDNGFWLNEYCSKFLRAYGNRT